MASSYYLDVVKEPNLNTFLSAQLRLLQDHFKKLFPSATITVQDPNEGKHTGLETAKKITLCLDYKSLSFTLSPLMECFFMSDEELKRLIEHEYTKAKLVLDQKAMMLFGTSFEERMTRLGYSDKWSLAYDYIGKVRTTVLKIRVTGAYSGTSAKQATICAFSDLLRISDEELKQRVIEACDKVRVS